MIVQYIPKDWPTNKKRPQESGLTNYKQLNNTTVNTFNQGYQDAIECLDWSNVPIEDATIIVASYQLLAEQSSNPYVVGVARGAEAGFLRTVAE